jgi:hypothetical protein
LEGAQNRRRDFFVRSKANFRRSSAPPLASVST